MGWIYSSGAYPNVKKKKNKSGYFSFFHKMGQSEWIQEAQVNAFATYLYSSIWWDQRNGTSFEFVYATV